ncbi:MAG: hypothetical protein K2Y21_01540 [Phycisphaerales bacterium]|nr:hypothetical protein [Phycisphaerales bacterium]
MASKRSSSPPPPSWGRGLHAFAERSGIAIAAALQRLGTIARHGSVAIPHLRRGARVAVGSARGHHGSLAMVGVWLITGVAILSLFLYALASRTPSWFHPVNPHDPVLIDLAQRVENRVITQLYKYRGEVDPATRATGEPWTLTITQDEATAWLNCKLPDWVRNLDDSATWPSEISNLQARIDPSRLWVAAALRNSSVASFGAAPRADDRGLRLASARAGIGSLSLPASWFGGTTRSLIEHAAGKPAAARAWDLATGAAPLSEQPSIRLEDGRRVRVLAVELTPGTLTLRCQTEAPQR